MALLSKRARLMGAVTRSWDSGAEVLQQKRRKDDYTKVYAAAFVRSSPHRGAAGFALIFPDGERGALAAFPEALCRMSNRRFSANLVRPLVYLCAYANHGGLMKFTRPNLGEGLDKNSRAATATTLALAIVDSVPIVPSAGQAAALN